MTPEQAKLNNEIREKTWGKKQPRDFPIFPLTGIITNCCKAIALGTNLFSPDGSVELMKFTATSQIICKKCRRVIDPHPLETAHNKETLNPTPRPTPITTTKGTAVSLTHPISFSALVTRVLDADTFEATIDLGFHVNISATIRLANCDAPERGTTLGDDARLQVKSLLEGKIVSLTTYRERDKYGRQLADVLMPDGKTLRNFLAEKGFTK
jgi:endonuclease YncB( thermonuclease family)